MGRIVAAVRITNLFDPERSLECDALVDTGAAYMVLPRAWKARLGDLRVIREIDCETATQQLVRAPVCGPVEIRVEGFEPVYGEVLFFDMEPADGIYEPLLGYIVLEQCQAAVDMLGLGVVHAKKADLRAAIWSQSAGLYVLQRSARARERPKAYGVLSGTIECLLRLTNTQQEGVSHALYSLR